MDGRVTLQNHYSRVHVQLSGNCKMWRSEKTSEDGGWLSADVFVDIVEQQWHANLKVLNIFAPVRYITLMYIFHDHWKCSPFVVYFDTVCPYRHGNIIS